MIKKIDIIIPVWAGAELKSEDRERIKSYTELCINSIREKTKDFNIIIVDNGSTLDIVEWLNNYAMEFENFYIIHHVKNLGYVGGVNAGIKFSREVTRSPYIAIVTNDTIAPTGWFESMKAFFENPKIAMVGPISNNVAGRQHISLNNSKYSHETVDFLIGLFYIIRADVVDQLIALDGFYLDELFNYSSSDDLDLSIRVRNRGYKLLIDRKVYVHHFLSVSLSKLAEQQGESLSQLHGRGFEIFKKKHKIESLNNQREPLVFIGVPSVSEKIDYRFWLSTVTQNLNFQHIWAPPIIRMMPDMARNILAQMAIDYGCTHLLILDDDSLFDDQNLFIKLIAHDKDIVGVKAYTRKPPHMPCVFYKTAQGFFQEVDFDSCGLREVGALGMAVTLIKTDVFRKMPEPWFEFGRVNVLGRGHERIGEDLYFCDKAIKAGFKVYCDTDIETAHVGDNMIVSRKSYHAATGKVAVQTEKIKN